MNDHIKEVQESLSDVFQSIATHDGELNASFTHAIVSLKQIASGLDIVSQIAYGTADAEQKDMIKNIHPTLITILSMAVLEFHKATNNQVDLDKCIDWANKIDGQMDRAVDVIRKK